jgi:hypothetical protein
MGILYKVARDNLTSNANCERFDLVTQCKQFRDQIQRQFRQDFSPAGPPVHAGDGAAEAIS